MDDSPIEATEEAGAPQGAPPPSPVQPRRSRWWIAFVFLLPALALLGALVVYPIFFSTWRSLYDRVGSRFVGLDNYVTMFTTDRTFIAVRNTAIWVLVVPALVTVIGLVFAVMVERVKFATAFKIAIFMPMAISFLSAGVIWRVVYEESPERGLANAALQGVAGIFKEPGPYSGARPSDEEVLASEGDTLVVKAPVPTGSSVDIGLIAISPESIPVDASTVTVAPPAGANQITGVVWLDFTKGGGGAPGVLDPTERGLPGAKVEAVRDGGVAASATAGADGSFVLDGLARGEYQVRLAESTLRPPFGGANWLARPLITPAIMVAYIWIWAGFAMVIIAAGLAAIPREVLEAARVDGATELQVFRRVTAPLLAPVLAVVLVTLVINVLKIFDLVFVIAPGSALRDANVLAVEMWNASFVGRDFGLGSALSVFLLVLVIPAMAFNVRRFRRES